MSCSDGLVCRGNICIEESCQTANECDLATPYCVMPPDGTCSERCTEDSECPGKGQGAEHQFCEAEACVECRTANDCTAATPVCSGGACVACTEHDQCASGACRTDGTCATGDHVAHVNVVGSPSSDCTVASPCSTIERALALLPTRPYIVLASGTYTRTGPLTILDTRWLIGHGTPNPILDRLDDGPIIIAQAAVDLHLERFELSGATGGISAPQLTGYGLYCKATAGAPKVSLRNMVVRGNFRGVNSVNCTVSIVKSTFTGMDLGIELRDSMGIVDSNTFLAAPVTLDAGVFTFRNNFVARSLGSGVEFYSSSTGNVFEFNTIVDNGLMYDPSYGVSCQLTTPASFPNNIIARNRASTSGTSCTYPGSIIVDTDISALKFTQPNVPPYDYHLMPGSMAIDLAAASTLDHDIDGDARPKGAGRDVGADEAQ